MTMVEPPRTAESGTAPMRALLGRLKGVKRSGAGFVSLCPAHEDDNPSLSITEGRDGRVLVNCHAGCQTDSIMRAVGLEMTELFPAKEKPLSSPLETERPRLVKTYDYADADGNLVFQVCRFVSPNGKKTFRQRRPDGKGGWIYNLENVRPVLYRLPDLMRAAESGRTIYVVEGEKDADALAELGYIATTSPMGAGKWRDSYSLSVAGAEVVVFPDNDEPGRAHAEEVAASLTICKCTVKIVDLPNIPPKGDFSDWLANDRNNLDELEELIGKTRFWSADQNDPTRRSRYRLDELWGNNSIMQPPPVVVPRLAWSGRLTLLAAREKAGKSTLTGYITSQVSKGGFFLGFACVAGSVLVVSLEEFIGDTARRLRHFEADATRVHLVDRLHADPKSRPEEIRTHIQAVEPKLVIIDSLSAYSNGIIQDENSATQMTAVIKPLADLAHEIGIAFIVLHHANKASGKARGSTGIMANADVVCEFSAPDEDTDPTLRTMRTAGRVPAIPRWDFRFDGDDYLLADGVTAPVESRIVGVVSSRPGISVHDLCDTVGGRRSDTHSAILKMIANGQIVNNGSANRMKLLVPAAGLGL